MGREAGSAVPDDREGAHDLQAAAAVHGLQDSIREQSERAHATAAADVCFSRGLGPKTDCADETDEEELHAGAPPPARMTSEEIARPLAHGMVASMGLAQRAIISNSNPTAQTFGGQFYHMSNPIVGTT